MRTIAKQVARYRVHIGEVSTAITITFWQDTETHLVSNEYSHGIKTPKQIDAHCPDQNASFAPLDYDARVSRLVSIMETHYDEAVAAGHPPSEDWIVRIPVNG